MKKVFSFKDTNTYIKMHWLFYCFDLFHSFNLYNIFRIISGFDLFKAARENCEQFANDIDPHACVANVNIEIECRWLLRENEHSPFYNPKPEQKVLSAWNAPFDFCLQKHFLSFFIVLLKLRPNLKSMILSLKVRGNSQMLSDGALNIPLNKTKWWTKKSHVLICNLLVC